MNGSHDLGADRKVPYLVRLFESEVVVSNR